MSGPGYPTHWDGCGHCNKCGAFVDMSSRYNGKTRDRNGWHECYAPPCPNCGEVEVHHGISPEGKPGFICTKCQHKFFSEMGYNTATRESANAQDDANQHPGPQTQPQAAASDKEPAAPRV